MKLPLLFALVVLFVLSAEAGIMSGRTSRNSPSSADRCDTLGIVQTATHTVHGRIMRATVKAWEDSVACAPGSVWQLYYPALAPGAYQASSWTSKRTNGMVGCPELVAFTVEAPYQIIFGWTTVGAVWDDRAGRVIGAAEMMKKLNTLDSLFNR